MALFGSKKNKDAEAAAPAEKAEKKTVKKAEKLAAASKASTAVAVAAPAGSADASVIIRPRVTEKSGLLSQSGTYTFEVSKNANKRLVSTAIAALYKVTPVKVAIINVPSKHVFVRGRRGVVSGFRKALVTLKKGDKIDFV